jgi:MATE family multidrug resistance protein
VASWAGLAALLAFVSLDRRMRRFRLLGRLWRADWPRFMQVWRLGLPIAATLLFEVGVFSGAVYVMGLIGTAELAAHQIAIQCAATTFMVPLGVAQAVTLRVGLAAGAGDRDGVRRAGWTGFALGVGFMAAMAAAISLARWPLVGAFLDLARPENLRAAALAAEFLLVAGLFQLFDGAQVVALGALRGLKDTRAPMLVAGLGYWGIAFPVGVALAFGLGLGGVGIWLGLALGLAAVAALLTRRFARRERLGLVGAAP